LAKYLVFNNLAML